MTSIIVAIFVVCNSFESLLFILHNQKMLRRDIIENYLRSIGDVLMVFNSSVNVIIYGLFSSQFKEKFSEMYLCKKKRERKIRRRVFTDTSNVIPSSGKFPRRVLNLSKQTNFSQSSSSIATTPTWFSELLKISQEEILNWYVVLTWFLKLMAYAS